MLVGFAFSCDTPVFPAFAGGNNSYSFALPTPYTTAAEELPETLIDLGTPPAGYNMATITKDNKIYVRAFLLENKVSTAFVIPVTLASTADPSGAVNLSSIKFEWKEVVTTNTPPTVTGAGSVTVSSSFVYGSVSYNAGIFANYALAPGETGFFVIDMQDADEQAAITKFKVSLKPAVVVGESSTETRFSVTAAFEVDKADAFMPYSTAIPTALTQDSTGLTFTLRNFSKTISCRMNQSAANGNLLMLYSLEQDTNAILPKYFTLISGDSAHYPGGPDISPEGEIKLFADIESPPVNATHCLLLTDFSDITPAATE